MSVCPQRRVQWIAFTRTFCLWKTASNRILGRSRWPQTYEIALPLDHRASYQTFVCRPTNRRRQRRRSSCARRLRDDYPRQGSGASHVRSLQDLIDTTTPQGMFSLQVLGAVAQIERALISVTCGGLVRLGSLQTLTHARATTLSSAFVNGPLSPKGPAHIPCASDGRLSDCTLRPEPTTRTMHSRASKTSLRNQARPRRRHSQPTTAALSAVNSLLRINPLTPN